MTFAPPAPIWPKARTLILFAAAQLFLIYWGHHSAGTAMGDIWSAYLPWAQQMAQNHNLLGLTAPWVYPFPDLIWILLPTWISTPAHYAAVWPVMAIGINIVAAAFVLFGAKIRPTLAIRAVEVWAVSALLLGSVTISRIDGISLAFVVVGLVFWLRQSQGASAAWITVAAWFKVWPVALIAGMFLVAKKRRRFIVWVAATGASVLLVGLLLGNIANIASFFSDQQGRSVQIESPWAVFWLWAAVRNVPQTGIHYNTTMLTFEVYGPYTQLVAHLLGYVMVAALLITLFLGWRATRVAGAEKGNHLSQVLVWVATTGILDLIVFNKVGSPQYYMWLIAPLLLGTSLGLPGLVSLRRGLYLVFGLTQALYPFGYRFLLEHHVSGVGLVTVRDLVAIALLVYANLRLSKLGQVQPNN